MEFEWDAPKAAANLRKHGVSFDEAVALIDPVLAKAFPMSEAVNQALRGLLALADETARMTGRSKRSVSKRVAV